MNAWICTPATDRDLESGLSEVRRLKGGVRPFWGSGFIFDCFEKNVCLEVFLLLLRYLSFYFFFCVFLMSFLFIFCFKGSLHSDRAKVTRVTVGRDMHQPTKVFELVKLILRP